MELGITIAFWVLAAVMIGAAVAVVFFRNIFHAALFLVLCFFTVAGIFVVLSADFLAGAQVLIYVGAIGVLIIFAVMLTRETQRGNPSGRLRLPAFLVGLLFLITMILVVVTTDWSVIADIPEPTVSSLAQALFSKEEGFVLAFEIAAALLLAAIIGAIALVRDK